jgi:hypothetical protein
MVGQSVIRQGAGPAHMAEAYAAERASSLRRRNTLIAGMAAVVLVLCVLRYAVTGGGGGGGGGVAHYASAATKKPAYGCMLDAGSTGSRIHVYHFGHDAATGEIDEVLGEVFEQVKPGVSSYTDPAQAGVSIEPLLAVCKREVPASEWGSTPIALYATAGLRLLPIAQSEAILQSLRMALSKTPFKFR